MKKKQIGIVLGLIVILAGVWFFAYMLEENDLGEDQEETAEDESGPAENAPEDPDEEAFIEDPALDSLIREQLGKENDEPLTAGELHTIQVLRAAGKEITTLDGAEHLTGLAVFDVRNNRIEDFEPVSGLRHLRELYVFGNPGSEEAGDDFHGSETYVDIAREPIPFLYLSAAEEDIEELYSRDLFNDDRIDGTVSFEDPEAEAQEVAFRYRGNSSRYAPKKSFNIRFEEDQPFLFDHDRMNLNAVWTDPTIMRDRLSMEMFSELGQPAPSVEYFHLVINDVYEGLYFHVDRIDHNFIERQGLDAGSEPEGTLIRDELRDNDDLEVESVFGFDIESVENPEEFLENNFNYRGDPDWSRLYDLIVWLNESEPGETFTEEFDERFDRENFTDWLAVHILVGDMDAYGDDYWLYHEESSDQWHVIPWDKDLSFGSHTRSGFGVANHFFSYEVDLYPRGRWNNELIDLFYDTDELRDELYDRLLELMDETFTIDYFEAKIDDYYEWIERSLADTEGMEKFELHTANHMGDPEHSEYFRDVLKDYVHLRYEYLKQEIEGKGETAYEALLEGESLEAGEIVHLTDEQGWVIASFTPDEPFEDADLAIRADEAEDAEGIAREWTIESGQELSGEWNFYYRNDVAPGLGIENWFIVDEPIEDESYSQWDLKLAEYEEEPAFLDSRVNPYSNKVSARMTVAEGESRYRILLNE
ncbi:hypothetical protein CR205_15925 [Alteribacter lacisalsi]|uniref:Spore coat protein CotH n=1 Tax=Alteribacter lacisalsi TaxID=2045244 RepID=A0A2W0HGD0_9BACI|nr:CotH kinase family protein [Alteribacter lacisalsi]PYZ95869.1 hypothetical protein CR205_15925 [Alteribacter lacisalsi]